MTPGEHWLDRVTDDIREAARKRIKGRRDFWPMLGLLIATVLAAISTFGPGSKPITDERIDEEIRRMGGSSGPSA